VSATRRPRAARAAADRAAAPAAPAAAAPPAAPAAHRPADAGREPAAAHPAAGLRIAYVVGRYPAPSHTFIQREIAGLRACGAEVQPFSIHRPAAVRVLAPQDRAERAATVVVLGGRRATAAALLRALARARTRAPRGLLAAARRALALRRPGLRALAWQLFYLLEALVVWAECDRRGIRQLHAHHLNQAADVALLAAAIGGDGWRWSLTIHGPDELYEVGRFKLAEKVRDAALVACISDFCRSQAMAHVEPAQWAKLHVVHCGVDPRTWRPPAGDAAAPPDRAAPAPATGDAAGAPILAHPLRILTVGRLVPQKGHAILLDALALLRREGLEIAAELIGDGPHRGALERRARELGLAGVVTFAGALGQDAVRARFERADVFCLPSFAEGVPVVLMEAMALELPVVTTRVMGIPELVDDGKSGLLVPPGRADAVADALRRLARDPAERRRLGAAGRRTVQERFDCTREAARLGELLAEVAR
jgi:colanic acid/amylovoran biosynthesis glycosyltransferase